MMIRDALAQLIDGCDLSLDQAESAMAEIMAGEATDAQIAGFLVALRSKGETVDEIAGLARAMRTESTRVETKSTSLVDVCGTGGDGLGTFNISTTVSFVAAGAGCAVAKHGNRSVSSRCGSADVLEELGVCLDLGANAVGQCIDELGIGFLYAPRLHPAMKHAVGPRREMGIRTVFNLLGPLTNPACAHVQLLGVYDPTYTEPLARVLQTLGGRSAFVVHGGGGLDELSTLGPSRVTQLAGDRIESFVLDARSLGLPKASLADLRGGDACENAFILRSILAGEPGPKRDIVLLNAACVLVAAGRSADLAKGLAVAAESIDSGTARHCLDALISLTQRLGERR